MFSRILGKRVKEGKKCFHINESIHHCFRAILEDSCFLENNNKQIYLQVNNSTLDC